MFNLIWDAPGERFFEAGVDHGVLYVQEKSGVYGAGVVWNGLTAVTEAPTGAELTNLWSDNIKYASLRSAETFGGTIEAYTYPDEFAACDGSAELAPGVTIGQQSRKNFGMSYRTKIGSDTDTEMSGYKLHLVYGASASPSEKAYTTINDSPDAITFSWSFETTPVPVPGHKPTALLTVDSTKVDVTKLALLESILYGTAAVEANPEAQPPVEAVAAIPPRLPLPSEVAALIGV